VQDRGIAATRDEEIALFVMAARRPARCDKAEAGIGAAPAETC
jgi:hypothetical protein